MGVPVLAGFLAGDVAAGLVATLGAFTALYGNDRPYRNRAVLLAVIAASFALSVMLGIQASRVGYLVIPAVVLVAVASTFLCNALRTGPPGAYLFALACAAGAGMAPRYLPVTEAGMLVFAGGAFAWLAHMAGVFFKARGPEAAAVIAAAHATARLAGAVGSSTEDGARHGAAVSLYHAWTVLVTWQPARPRPSAALGDLRALNRELHRIFSAIPDASAASGAALEAAAQRARSIAARVRERTEPQDPGKPVHVPLGHHGPLESLREHFRPWSPTLLATTRVGLAAILAGAVGIALGLERAYWAMAAAVLILHQGLDFRRSLRRGIERMGGTFAGLVVAGVVLASDPQGPWLAATLMLFVFIIEMMVLRNYAVAVVFITVVALLIASGGEPVADMGQLLWARGVDTFIGCATGLLVLVLMAWRSVEIRIPLELVGTLVAVKRVLAHAAEGDVASGPARRARRDLQQHTITLLQAYDAGMGATPWNRAAAARSWPAVSAAQRLAYRALSLCWKLESAGAARKAVARATFGPQGAQQVGRALLELARAIHGVAPPAPIAQLPAFLDTEIRNLHELLVR